MAKIAPGHTGFGSSGVAPGLSEEVPETLIALGGGARAGHTETVKEELLSDEDEKTPSPPSPALTDQPADEGDCSGAYWW